MHASKSLCKAETKSAQIVRWTPAAGDVLLLLLPLLLLLLVNLKAVRDLCTCRDKRLYPSI